MLSITTRHSASRTCTRGSWTRQFG